MSGLVGNPFLLTSAGGATGYQIERSLRFNSADSAYLSRTPASAGNRKTWTWSGWVKRSALVTGGRQSLFSSTGATDPDWCEFGFEDGLFYITTLSTTNSSASVFRDPSAWFHLVVAFDTTLATASDRAIIWINNTRIPITINIFSLNTDYGINRTSAHYIGNSTFASRYFSGYLAEVHFIDGQALTPSSFGETDINGVWQPKAYTGTYGTNGFQLKFADNSAATATTLGKDTSPNGNNFTPNNLSVTVGVGNDSLVDTPTNYGSDTGAGGEVRGNYCTLNPLDIGANISNAQGNLYALKTTTGWTSQRSTIGVSTGKYYFEGLVTGAIDSSGAQKQAMIGVANNAASLATYIGVDANGWSYNFDGLKINAGAGSAYGAAYTGGDIISVAIDLDNSKIWFAKNGTWQAGGNPATGANAAYSNVTGTVIPAIGLGGLAAGNVSWDMNFGQRPWNYPSSVPSGFKALCTQNLPAPTITKPSTVMDVALWTGNGSARSITGLGFNPDLVWIKGRSGATDHALYDSVRGATIDLVSNSTAAETTQTQGLTAFNSDGFSLGTLAKVNTNAATYAGWAFDAGSSTVTNPDGTISSQVRANASAGFSIVTYTGNGTNNSTVGHGLGVAPTFLIGMDRTGGNWQVWGANMNNGSFDCVMNLNTADPLATGITTRFRAASSSTFTIGTDGDINGNGNTYVTYCFAPVAGYSAFGSYTGNGNADGPFIYTGFRPRWVMIKNTGYAGQSWWILDTARDDYNVTDNYLQANNANAEGTFTVGDILSNGFKIRTTDFALNRSGDSIIFAAFAEAPFALARAR